MPDRHRTHSVAQLRDHGEVIRRPHAVDRSVPVDPRVEHVAVRHVADHPETSKLVLLSAHCGGKNMLPLSCRNGLLARDRLEEYLSLARTLAPRQLMPMPGWWYVITAEGFLDLQNCPDILELAPKIRCPVLYIRGDKEPPDLYPAEEFAKKANCRVEIVANCDHFYNGREEAVCELVSRWLA